MSTSELPEEPVFFDPNDPRMAGKRYLADDDPRMQRSRKAFEDWVETARPKVGDLVPEEARMWFATRTRMLKVALDLQTGELWFHDYPYWHDVTGAQEDGYDE